MLRAIVDLYEEDGDQISVRTIDRRSGMDGDTVQRALRKLMTRPSFLEDVTTQPRESSCTSELRRPTRSESQEHGHLRRPWWSAW